MMFIWRRMADCDLCDFYDGCDEDGLRRGEIVDARVVGHLVGRCQLRTR